MKRGPNWAFGLGIAAALLVALGLAAAWWLPGDEDLAAWLVAHSEERLGVKVSIGSAHWALLPKPVVVVDGFRTQQAQPVAFRQLRAYPDVRALLRRELAFERIDIHDAVFPGISVAALGPGSATGGPDAVPDVPLQHFEFRNLTWISYNGIAVPFDGEIDFDAHWRPRRAELRRPGAHPLFTLTSTREGDADRWSIRIHVGGGTAHGALALKSAASGEMQLVGQLDPQDIEVASALSTFNRRSLVSGKGSGRTVVSAEGKSVRELIRSLHTCTVFSVDDATILRFDLDKAIGTRGKEHDGETPLQTLTGQMDTQNTSRGMRVSYTALRARAGKYTATGEATTYRGRIEASGTLDLIEGAMGMPFTVSGPTAKPTASVPPGFLAGAAIGTAVLPGIGTVIGARIGGSLGRVFKGGVPSGPAPEAPK